MATFSPRSKNMARRLLRRVRSPGVITCYAFEETYLMLFWRVNSGSCLTNFRASATGYSDFWSKFWTASLHRGQGTSQSRGSQGSLWLDIQLLPSLFHPFSVFLVLLSPHRDSYSSGTQTDNLELLSVICPHCNVCMCRDTPIFKSPRIEWMI